MSDFSVGKFSVPNEVKFASGRTSDYTRTLSAYKAFKSQTSQSDFANAPVAMQNEIDMLIKLKEFADKEKLPKELKWIETRLAELTEKLTSTKINLLANAYYAPINMHTGNRQNSDKPDEKLLAMLNSCKNRDGFLDPNAEKLLGALKGKENSIYHVEEVLNKCRDEDGSVNADKAQAVFEMASVEVAPARMCEFVDRVTYFDEALGKDCIDFETVSNIKSFKQEGLNDVDSVKFAEYLNGNFEDKASITSSLLKLYKADVNPASIVEIMSALAVPDTENGKLKVSPKAVGNIASLKKAMFSTRNNETNERNNQINLLGVSVFKFDDITMVSKNGKLTYMTPVEGEPDVEVTKERYDDLVSSIEDNMLLEFAGKYKEKDGEIDGKYVRLASHLRNAGIVYNGLFNLVDSCIKEDGTIDSDRIDVIKTLKASGALSDDVPILLEACEKDDDGKYSQSDITDICDLTSCVIGGKDVCSLLPAVRGNDGVKDITMICGANFSNNEKLFEVLDMLKQSDGEFGENEIELFYDLASTYFSKKENVGDEDEFLKISKEIMKISRSKDGTISDDATGICAIMRQHGESVYAIRNGLMYCYGDDFKVDGKLSQILWNMYLQDANSDEVLQMINVCKTSDGKVDYDKADMINKLFEAEFPKEKIAQLVQH